MYRPVNGYTRAKIIDVIRERFKGKAVETNYSEEEIRRAAAEEVAWT